MPFLSYAQNREDVMLRRALAGVERGFYVDVGANDPVADSVTKAFYDAGWRGINVEPVEHWFRRLVLDRPEDVNLQVAAAAREGTIELFVIAGSGLSTSDPRIADEHAHALSVIPLPQQVAARTLTTICREHAPRDIHFLKIDVEGAEQAVLEGLDLSTIRPWILLVESTRPNSPVESAGWEPLVTGRGYHRVWFDGLNRFYVADEHARLDAAFRTPPSVWDDFETYGHRAALESAAVSGARAAELAGRVAKAEADLGQALAGHAEDLRQWQERAAAAESELQSIKASRSWRITLPLRLASRAVHEATHGPDGRRLGPRAAIRAGGVVARKAMRRIARRAWRFAHDHPSVMRIPVRVMRLVPGLPPLLRRLAAPATAGESVPPPAPGPSSPQDLLPPRARRIFAALRPRRASTTG